MIRPDSTSSRASASLQLVVACRCHDPGNVNHAVDELLLRHQHCVLMSLDRGDLSLCHHANIHDSASDLDLWSSHCLLHLLDPGSPSLHLYRDRDVIGAIKKLSLWNFNRFVGFLDERWAAALASRRCMNDVGNVLNLWHVHRFLHSLNGGNGSLHHDGNIQNSVNERHLWDLGRPLHLLNNGRHLFSSQRARQPLDGDAVSDEPPPSSVLCVDCWYLALLDNWDIDRPVNVLHFRDLHGFLHLLNHRQMSLHHHRRVCNLLHSCWTRSCGANFNTATVSSKI